MIQAVIISIYQYRWPCQQALKLLASLANSERYMLMRGASFMVDVLKVHLFSINNETQVPTAVGHIGQFSVWLFGGHHWLL